jgi:hypothetical protein
LWPIPPLLVLVNASQCYVTARGGPHTLQRLADTSAAGTAGTANSPH